MTSDVQREERHLADSGLEYCIVHHGVVECDGGDGPCDFASEHKCPSCNGEGRIVDERGEGHGCDDCDRGGLTLCDLRPLMYDAAPVGIGRHFDGGAT